MLLSLLTISLFATFATAAEATDLGTHLVPNLAQTTPESSPLPGPEQTRAESPLSPNLEQPTSMESATTRPRFACCAKHCGRGTRFNRITSRVAETFKKHTELFKKINKMANPLAGFAYVFTQVAEKLQKKYRTTLVLDIPDGVFEMLAMGCFIETLLSAVLTKDKNAPKKILNPEVTKNLCFRYPFGAMYDFSIGGYNFFFHNLRLKPLGGAFIFWFLVLAIWNITELMITFGPEYAHKHADPKLANLHSWENATAGIWDHQWLPNWIHVLHTSKNTMKIAFPPYNGVSGNNPVDWFLHELPTIRGLTEVFWNIVTMLYHALPVFSLKPVKVLMMLVYEHGEDNPNTRLGRVCHFMTGIYTDIVKEHPRSCDFFKCAGFIVLLLLLGEIKDIITDQFFVVLPSEIAKLGGFVSAAYFVAALFLNRPAFPILLSIGSASTIGMSLWRLISEAIYEESREWKGLLEYGAIFLVWYYFATGFHPLFVDDPEAEPLTREFGVQVNPLLTAEFGIQVNLPLTRETGIQLHPMHMAQLPLLQLTVDDVETHAPAEEVDP